MTETPAPYYHRESMTTRARQLELALDACRAALYRLTEEESPSDAHCRECPTCTDNLHYAECPWCSGLVRCEDTCPVKQADEARALAEGLLAASAGGQEGGG
jgi:hypothetical protein